MAFDIVALFKTDDTIRRLESLPVMKTTIMDSIFGDRIQHASPVIPAETVTSVYKELPLVRRGAPAIPATSATGGFVWYEPYPIHPYVAVTAADINNIRSIGPSGQEAWARERTEFLRRSVHMTIEGMCSAVLSGSLSWPVQIEGGGNDTYEIDYGSILSVTPDVLWDAATPAKIKDVWKTLSEMEEALEEKGFGGSKIIQAGSSAYWQLMKLAEAVTSTAKIRVDINEQGINIGGYLITRMAETYNHPTSGSTAKLGTKVCRMVATDAMHKLAYAAVDDIDANFQPLPFHVKAIKTDDPSGYRLIAQSKPLPIPNVNGICTATVMS